VKELSEGLSEQDGWISVRLAHLRPDQEELKATLDKVAAQARASSLV